jgi:hypothetical protein
MLIDQPVALDQECTMQRAAASLLIALSLSLGVSGTASARSGPSHPTSKRCPTRACRDSRTGHTQANATVVTRP